MPALIENIEIEQGATFQREYTVVEAKTGLPLVGFEDGEFSGMLRTLDGSLVATFDLNATGPKTCVAELTDIVTEGIPAELDYTHKYDIKVKRIGGPTYRIAEGRASLSEQQTYV